MQLVANWKAVLWGSWSIRLLALISVLSALEMVLPLINEAWDINPRIYAGMILAVSITAKVVRLIYQAGLEEFPDEKA